MAITQEELTKILSKAFPEADILIKDLAGDNDHYQLEIASKSFAGKTRVEQHKMVNEALKEILRDRLHALSIITKTKE